MSLLEMREKCSGTDIVFTAMIMDLSNLVANYAVDDILWFDGHTLMSRSYELDNVCVSWDPIVFDQAEDLPF